MAPIVERIRRHFLWLLLGAYALAALLPGPGAEIARFDLGVRLGVGARITAPLMMVAVLLFLAAMAVEVRELRVLLQRPLLWLTAVACVWLGPVAAVGVAGWVLPAVASESAAGMLLGMTLVAAMPVANSSVAWTQQSGGSLPWSLGLVVLSILLTPWVTPRLLHLSGVALLSDEPELIEQATLAFSGAPFIVWVLLPTAAGLTTRRLLGPASTDELTSGRLLLSTAILLVLNYAAGSLALREQPTLGELAGALIAGFGLAAVGVVLATLLAVALRLEDPTEDALRFGLGMKHTGLAFALATTASLSDRPEAMLVIVTATPAQHLVAAGLDALRARRRNAEERRRE